MKRILIFRHGNAVLCRRIESAPPGWKHIKDSKDGYPIYAMDNGDRVQQHRRGRKKVAVHPKIKPVPLPGNVALVHLSVVPADIPKAKKTHTPQKGDVLETRYIYDNDRCIIRKQWNDETKPKGYAKSFTPCRKIYNPDGTTEFKYNKGDEPWGAYRINEVLEAIAQTKGTPMVLMQEGEGCVEIARSLSIASTCVDGSSWTTNGLTTALTPIKEVGSGSGIIFLADNDAPGEKKAKQIENVCTMLQIPCIVIKSAAICDIPEGGDIKEIMQQLDKDEFIERLLGEVHAAVEARSSTDDGDGGDWNDDDDDWGDDDDDGKTPKDLPKHSAMSSILKPLMGNLRYRDDYHQWMRYQDGYWTVASEESMFQMVTDAIEELYPTLGFPSSYPSGVGKMLQARLLCTNWEEAPRHLLPFKNGVLDLKTGRMLPHNPKYGFENIIDRVHNPEATDWSEISNWMDFVFEGNQDQKNLLICWYAAVLRGMWDLHRFALLIGEGGTGKSTAMQLATDLIGKRASHSLTLNALNTNNFQTGNIYDKRLVCINDADRYTGDLGIFKNITGGDEINVEWKFQKSFNAKYKGLVMATANNPVFTSNDSGLDRRVLMFRFDRKVDQIDPGFGERLSAQTDAFTNYLLTIPEDLIIKTLIYKVDLSGVRIQNELEALRQTNNVAAWMDANLAYDPDGEIQIGSDKEKLLQLYGNYHDFCTKSGSKNIRSSTSFSPEILRLSKGLLIKAKTNSGAVIRGVRLCENGGLLETLKKMQNIEFSSNPSHPSHPSRNPENTYPVSSVEVTGKTDNPSPTRHTPQNQVTGSDDLKDNPSPTRHAPQNITVQESQPLNNVSVTGVTGCSENTRKEENKLIIVMEGKADYLGDVVTIDGFDGKKGTVDIKFASGRKMTVKRNTLKPVSVTPAYPPSNAQSPMTSDQQSLNL